MNASPAPQPVKLVLGDPYQSIKAIHPDHMERPLAGLQTEVSFWLTNEAGAFLSRHGGKNGNLVRVIERGANEAKVAWVPHGGNQVATAIVPVEWLDFNIADCIYKAVREYPSAYGMC